MTMKKAFKITTYCLIVSGVIALGLCYLIIPERTKFAIDIVVDYLNKPLGVAFGTTITLGLVIGVVLKIVWDRHKDSIKKDISDYKQVIESEKAKLELAKKELETKESDIKTLLSNYSQRIDNLTELLVKVCETIPNAKIKALGVEIKSTQNEIKHDLEQKQELVEKYSDKELTEIFNKLADLEKVVKTYGERKETTND